jgi:hypothetical protein
MTPRDRRALQIGGGVILAALLLVRMVPLAWRGWREAVETLESRRELLARARGEIAGETALDSAAAEVRRRFIGLAPRLVAGGSSAEAEATLGALTSSLADGAHVRVKRVGGAPDSAVAGPLRGVQVDLELEGDWAGATRFLRALSNEPVSLALEKLEVQSVDPASPGDRAEVLVVRAGVTGWYLPAEGR